MSLQVLEAVSEKATTTNQSHRPVQIAFICDDSYVVPTCVAIASAIASKEPESEYEINVIGDELSNESERLFQSFATENVHINVFCSSSKEFEDLHDFTAGGVAVATKAAMIKFRLADILSSLDRVLYMDGDIIVRKDLSEIYLIDLGDDYVAAVRDSGTMYSHRDQSYYFNSGLMLLNLDLIRKDELAAELIKQKRLSTSSNLVDQSIFNLVFDERIHPLRIKWNLLAVNLERAKAKWSFEQLNLLYDEQYTSIEEMVADAGVLHFSSKDKPWKNEEAPYAELWYEHCNNAAGTNPVFKTALDSFLAQFAEESPKRPRRRIRGFIYKVPPFNAIIRRIKKLEASTKSLSRTIRSSQASTRRELKRRLSIGRFNANINRINKELLNMWRTVPINHLCPPDKGHPEIIASLTSFPERIVNCADVVLMLFHQTMQPNRIILTLYEGEFPNREKDLPPQLTQYLDKGLEILWCQDNLMGHKKYFYAMQQHPDSIIVTFDDDIQYDSDCIERLYKNHLIYPNAVIASRAHEITLDEDGAIAPYKAWHMNTPLVHEARKDILATNGAGSLFPPGLLPSETFAKEAILSLALKADDVWLKFMEMLVDVPTVSTQDIFLGLYLLPDTQDACLWKENVSEGGNDAAIEALLTEYGDQMPNGNLAETIRVDKLMHRLTA